MEGVGGTSTARLAADTDALPEAACESDDDGGDDDDGMILDEGYYYCYCQEYDADEGGCTSTLSAEAFQTITCADLQALFATVILAAAMWTRAAPAP